jgi:phosphoribosylpyrophosphate synthetase
MSGYLYRSLVSERYNEVADIFGLDYYNRDGCGEDVFSRELVWFYVYGDEELREKLGSSFSDMMETIFSEDSEEWDLVTLYPTNVKNDLNQNLLQLVRERSEEFGIPFRQVIWRTDNIRDNHEMDSFKKKVVNLEDSVDVADVEGESVIVVDNITLSGASMLHATEKLKEKGADRVACVCLGMGVGGRMVDEEIDDRSFSEVVDERGSDVKADSLAKQSTM